MTSLQEIITKTIQDTGLIYTAIGNVGNTLLGALFWFVLASVVSVAEYGKVNYVIAIAVVPATIGVLGLNTTVTTFLAKGYREIVFEGNSIVLVTSLIAGATVFILYGLEAALVTISLMYYTMSISTIVGSKRFDEYALTIIIQRVIQIISAVTLYFYLGVAGIIIGYALGPLMASYRFIQSLKGFTLRLSQVKEKIMFTIHSYGLTLTQTFSMYLDKIIIGYLFGFTVLGLYQLAFQFLMVVMVIPSILFTYLLPHEASGTIVKNIKYLGILISFLISTLIYLLSPFVLEILFPMYINAIPLVQIISWSLIPITFASISNAKLLGQERSKVALIGGVIHITSLILTLPILGASFGNLGLASAIILTHTLKAIYLLKNTGL